MQKRDLPVAVGRFKGKVTSRRCRTIPGSARLLAIGYQVNPGTGNRASAVSVPVHGIKSPLALEVHDLSAIEPDGNFEENL